MTRPVTGTSSTSTFNTNGAQQVDTRAIQMAKIAGEAEITGGNIFAAKNQRELAFRPTRNVPITPISTASKEVQYIANQLAKLAKAAHVATHNP